MNTTMIDNEKRQFKKTSYIFVKLSGFLEDI